jgi:hypothetical protein
MGYSAGAPDLAALALEATVDAVATDVTAVQSTIDDLLANTTEAGHDGVGPVSGGPTIRQLVASAANPIRSIELSGQISGISALCNVEVILYTGPGGSEVSRGVYYAHFPAAAQYTNFYIRADVSLPAGTRVAWSYQTSNPGTATANIFLGYTIHERS